MKNDIIEYIIPELKQALITNSSAVLNAPPGSGKTTTVPLVLLDMIPAEKGRILMLEPRRIAAVSAARWMARKLGEEAGETIGYSIRFERRTSKKTRIEVVTEGILTRRMQTDPGLEGVAMIIFDEFHERSLQADLALSLCLDLRQTLREDLKILIMSATLDVSPVALLLGDAPVITMTGAVFPVEEQYLPERKERPLAVRIADAVVRALKETSGDILVFLPGSGEIRSCSDTLRPVLERKAGELSLHSLYGELPFEEQERAILTSEKRKIVLATNIAETSLTIEGVQVVVDSGLTRRLQHDPSTGMNRLITVTVSKASAEQRKGRAGRLGPGMCYRLYSRQDFQSLIPFNPPEILLSDLSSLVLELAAWGVKNPAALFWLDPPPEAAWHSALHLLTALGALDSAGSVTRIGKAMANLPLHPRLARMMLRAGELGCPGLGADLAALLSERDVFKRGIAKNPDIAERIDTLRLWRREKSVPVAADLWGLRAADRTSRHLLRLIASSSKEYEHAATEDEMISRLLLSGFPDRLAKRRDEGEGRFLVTQGRGVRLSPLNCLSRSRFIIAVNVDLGTKAEGSVHLAAPVDEDIIRQECGRSIGIKQTVEWEKRENRLKATVEECLGSVVLSSKHFDPSDEEAVPLLCEAIKSESSVLLRFTEEDRAFQGRVALMKRTYPEESWPDLSVKWLCASPEEWLLPWLSGIRSARELRSLVLLPALRAQLSTDKLHLLNQRAPMALIVPSGNRAAVDYALGDIPVLAVKLQEMFGLADTPELCEGRLKVLLHLLSPSRRPVQITRDLRGFWNSGYQEVKKEMKGRYPKHPWPDDPWNAIPTRKTKSRIK